MYCPDKIKPFLLHPVASVRNFAGDYFYNRHYQPPKLVEQVFKAVDLQAFQIGPKALKALCRRRRRRS